MSPLEKVDSDIESGNGDEALLYANKALELDSSNAEAWVTKMKAVGLTAILKELKCNDVVVAGQKAINFDPSKKIEVYSYFLAKCLNDLQFCMTQMQDTKVMKDLYNANLQVNFMKATEDTLAADTIADMILSQEGSILSLRLAVPNEEIANNDELARLTGEIAKQWVYYQNSINERFNVYGSAMNPEALQRYKDNLNLIKQGLPEGQQNVVDENQMSNATSGPCYVATAVYGSYDCPEVWTLRRFRDNILGPTWYGRTFIKAYYATSPTLVKHFGKNLWFKNLWKPQLDRLVARLKAKGVESTPYNDKEW